MSVENLRPSVALQVVFEPGHVYLASWYRTFLIALSSLIVGLVKSIGNDGEFVSNSPCVKVCLIMRRSCGFEA